MIYVINTYFILLKSMMVCKDKKGIVPESTLRAKIDSDKTVKYFIFMYILSVRFFD